MNSFRRQLNNQITNQNEESGTSLFNKVSGIAIAISILLAVLETESHSACTFREVESITPAVVKATPVPVNKGCPIGTNERAATRAVFLSFI